MSRPAARALAILTFINLFNYLDRYVVAALVESLKKPDALALTDTQAGLLSTGFLVVYMAASPVFGALGDRGARPRLIAAGVFLWSLATALGGLAVGFVSLFAARALVGVGEAAYGTISPGIIADLYPRERRGRVMATFFMAIPVGSALGYVLGGLVDKAAGWRAAFLVAGAPGMVLALLCARLADPPRGQHDEPEVAPRPGGLVATYGRLLRNRPYVMTVLGYAAYTFAIGGMAFWMPAFLERVRGVPKQEATTVFGGILVGTGFAGTFLGGWLGDRLLRRTPQAYLWLSGVATLLAVPLAWLVFTSPEPAVYYGAVVGAELLLFMSTGPINSAILNEVAPTERATAVALGIFLMHILGDVPSPALIGAVSDASGLDRAVLMVPVAIAVGGAIWCLEAILAGRADRARPADAAAG
ncbi:MAG: MFS transporter [Kofleriaceae bacterium]|nr:MFS transporter [Kofleriaceae bacterium]